MIFGALIDWIKASFGSPPASGFFIAIISLLLAIIYTILQQLIIDIHKVQIYGKRIRKWMAKYRKAMRTGNPRLISEVKKEEAYIRKLQMELSTEQLKVLGASLILFIIAYQIIVAAFDNQPVITLPFGLPIKWFGVLSGKYTMIYAFWWYFISYAAVTALINGILKIMGRRPF